MRLAGFPIYDPREICLCVLPNLSFPSSLTRTSCFNPNANNEFRLRGLLLDLAPRTFTEDYRVLRRMLHHTRSDTLYREFSLFATQDRGAE